MKKILNLDKKRIKSLKLMEKNTKSIIYKKSAECRLILKPAIP